MRGARVMRQLSTVTHRRHQWKHQATQRGARERYQRTQPARLSAERDRVTTALNAAQARLQQREAQRRQREAQRHRPVPRPTVDVVLLALQRFVVVRIGCRAVSRVLSRLAWALGITKAPGPHTVIHGVMRLAIVRIAAARGLKGVPLRQAPCPHGLIGMLDLRLGLGTGKIWAVLACDAHHHQRAPGALALEQVHCLGVCVADAWTGETIADVLQRLIAQMGRPAASRKDGGSDLHKATDVLGEHGVRRPCLDEIAHAVAGMRTRVYHDPPAFPTFVSACGPVSGTRKHPMLACVAPPTVRTKARWMPVHRLVTWADRVRTLAPAGGAKTGST